MVETGVKLHEEVVSEFNELKMKNTSQYLIYRLSDDFEWIILEKKGEKGESYQDMIKNLPTDLPRFVVYDYNLTTADGRKVRKLININYIPDVGTVKNKLVSASASKTLQSNLQGIGLTVRASDLSDLDEQEIIKKIK
jgi:cofilin